MKMVVRFLLLIACMFSTHMLNAQKTALLLIDIQDFYFPGGRLQLENAEAAGMNAGLILDQFKEK